MTIAAALDPMYVSIPEACRLMRVGRTTMYELIDDGEVEAVKVRSLTRITVDSIRRYDAARRSAAAARRAAATTTETVV